MSDPVNRSTERIELIRLIKKALEFAGTSGINTTAAIVADNLLTGSSDSVGALLRRLSERIPDLRPAGSALAASVDESLGLMHDAAELVGLAAAVISEATGEHWRCSHSVTFLQKPALPDLPLAGRLVDILRGREVLAPLEDDSETEARFRRFLEADDKLFAEGVAGRIIEALDNSDRPPRDDHALIARILLEALQERREEMQATEKGGEA